MDIVSIDNNFRGDCPAENGFIYHDVLTPPLRLEGFAWKNQNPFYRLPETFTEADVSSGALALAHHTAGGCIRFRSDSARIMIRAELDYISDLSHMPRTGSAGFDSFQRNGDETFIYNLTVFPNALQTKINTLCGVNRQGGTCEWQLNLPLYAGVRKIEIGIEPDSSLFVPSRHKTASPILFYGSSITQGACASRPGNAYSSLLCRRLDVEQINLGFSGSAKGETAIAKAIAKLNLSAFVFDYDHNSPNPEHLKATHESFFQVIRAEQPELPIIILSKCNFTNWGDDAQRRSVIRKTCENAWASGDRNVFFVDGESLFQHDMRDCCTVDGTHPNDLGFFRMYQKILPVLRQAIKRNGKETNAIVARKVCNIKNEFGKQKDHKESGGGK